MADHAYYHANISSFVGCRQEKSNCEEDIQQAFLQFKIAKEQNDFVPFLRFNNINETPRKTSNNDRGWTL